MRKIFFTAFLLVLVFTLAAITAFAEIQPVDVLVNGQKIVSDSPAFLDNDLGRTFVPVRFVSQALGAKVDWDESNQQAIVSHDGDQIIIPLTSVKAIIQKVNEAPREVTLDAPARIVNDRTMVPLRFVSETLGAKVEWVPPEGAAPGMVVITSTADVPDQKTNVVSIKIFKFDPAVLTIKKGDSVTWTNLDTAPHTATGSFFDSGTLTNGITFHFIFDQEGEFDYICSFHPSMKGKIVVQ